MREPRLEAGERTNGQSQLNKYTMSYEVNTSLHTGLWCWPSSPAAFIAVRSPPHVPPLRAPLDRYTQVSKCHRQKENSDSVICQQAQQHLTDGKSVPPEAATPGLSLQPAGTQLAADARSHNKAGSSSRCAAGQGSSWHPLDGDLLKPCSSSAQSHWGEQLG